MQRRRARVGPPRRVVVCGRLRNYPELAKEKSGFLERQLGSITYQQAQKDYQTAEFYRRTGHPGSAYFYYEVVRRRYTRVLRELQPGADADQGQPVSKELQKAVDDVSAKARTQLAANNRG